jgi:phosphoglycolate phosphatase-like HAD superfamily hydrolase
VTGQYRHILFDFDGTLADTAVMAAEEYESIRASHFSSLPPFAEGGFDRIYSGPLKQSPRRWLSEDDSATFFNLHSSRMRERANEVTLFEGMAELLTGLPDGSCSVVTSAYSTAVMDVFDKAGLEVRPWLHQIAGRELFQPKSVKISNILSEKDVANCEAVYVGDLESDILYCNSVPIDIIGVGYGYQSGEYVASCKPTHFCSDIKSLKQFVTSLFN